MPYSTDVGAGRDAYILRAVTAHNLFARAQCFSTLNRAISDKDAARNIKPTQIALNELYQVSRCPQVDLASADAASLQRLVDEITQGFADLEQQAHRLVNKVILTYDGRI